MERLSRLNGHFPFNKDLKKAQDLSYLKLQFELSYKRLKYLQFYFLQQMSLGLQSNEIKSPLKMLCSYVIKKDEIKNISGKYYALDLGGTNFRILEVTIKSGTIISIQASSYKIPLKFMQGIEATSDNLFNFLALKISETFKNVFKTNDNEIKQMGFTFSFPVHQTSLDNGILTNWTKGFATSDVVGHNVVALLNNSLQKYSNLKNLKCIALCNDTVGTLIAEYFNNPNTAQIGMIIGTGTNACYWEDVSQIIKLAESSTTTATTAVNAVKNSNDPNHPNSPTSSSSSFSLAGKNEESKKKKKKTKKCVLIWNGVILIVENIVKMYYNKMNLIKLLIKIHYVHHYPNLKKW